MAMMPAHFCKQFGVFLARGFVPDFLFEADLDRIVGVESGDPSVFDIDAGNPVACGRNDERFAKADLGRAGFDDSIPVRTS